MKIYDKLLRLIGYSLKRSSAQGDLLPAHPGSIWGPTIGDVTVTAIAPQGRACLLVKRTAGMPVVATPRLYEGQRDIVGRKRPPRLSAHVQWASGPSRRGRHGCIPAMISVGSRRGRYRARTAQSRDPVFRPIHTIHQTADRANILSHRPTGPRRARPEDKLRPVPMAASSREVPCGSPLSHHRAYGSRTTAVSLGI